jgi:hydrogenase/urease accessory protein HupE
LLDPVVAANYRDALVKLLSPRITIEFDGRPVPISWGAIDVVPERQSLRFAFTIAESAPGHTAIRAYVFPYDPIHQTFVNLYEDDQLMLQAILDASRQRVEYFAGTTQGRLAVIRTFVLSGIEHIMIGPDHILFLIGLLLLGGTLARLAVIVTAFTIGHSITLSLAALNMLTPPAYFIEPLIALTIVVVGADNLLVLRASPEQTQTTDIRAWLAAGFGLIHGFGFAYVLKEFGLPQAALGWSLFAFNVGVEIGQLMIVLVVAGALMALRSAAAGRVVAIVGSMAVIAAGVYWFIERVFLA